MTPPRRPTQGPDSRAADDWLSEDPFGGGAPASGKPRPVGWNGDRELPPMPMLSADQEVVAEAAVRVGGKVTDKLNDTAGAAVRGTLGQDEMASSEFDDTPRDTFGNPLPSGPGDPRRKQDRGGQPGRIRRMRARGRDLINNLAPFTLPDKPSGRSTASGNTPPARPLVRRAGSAALGSIPTIGRLRRSGDGSIALGIRLLANRNPLYRFLLSRLPIGGRPKLVIATGCGCVSGCGCGSSCCSFAGCFMPIIILFIVIGMSGALAERQPGFVKPLFCERNQAAFCSGESTSLTIQLGDIPPGAIEEYQAVEAATGVPWFYLAAWEKVATDFGRADFQDLHGGLVPGTAINATYDRLSRTVDGISDADGSTANLDAATRQTVQDALDAKADEVARLTSPLRGGSFGLMLITADEYAAYGQAPDGTWLDPWNRAEAAEIVARHLLDVYPALAVSNTGTLTYDGAPDIGRLDREVEDWVHLQFLTVEAGSDTTGIYDQLLSIIGRGTGGSCAGASSDPACVGGTTGSGGSETWWDGPRANSPITLPERFYVCQSILTEADVAAGGCDQFLGGTDMIEVDPAQGLADAVAVYYDLNDTIIPGEAVSDWGKLQILIGALLSTDPIWGADQTAYYQATKITPDGRVGETERVNSYAQAIVRYGRSVYDAWAAAQLAARNDSGAGRAEAAALAFWDPPATQVAKETGFPREFLLATLKADGAFGCLPGQGSSVTDAAATDWLAPLSVKVGKSMAAAMDFTGLTWIPLAAQMQWENGGDVKGNNPYNMIDDAGHARGTPTYASQGQTGWWRGGNAVEQHWFAVFDTLEHGSAVNANLYLGGLKDQNDWRGYGAVIAAGRAGDPLATARAIEASRWSSTHYGGNHIVPGTGELYHPNEPEKDGKIVRSVAGVSVATIGGCWRFGAGLAAPWTPPATTTVNGGAIAMNFCIATMVAAPGGCGSAIVKVGGRTVTLPVVGFWDGDIGQSNETFAGLNPAAASSLGLTGQGPWQVSIQLVKPLGATWPPEVTYPTPLEAVQALAAELRSLAGVAAPTVPNLGQLAPAWRTHSSCVIDRTQPVVQVPDPWNPSVTYSVGPWCQYLSDVILYTNVFLGGASGGEVETVFGVQPVSRFGYIWPIVGTYITSGFEPRTFATFFKVTYSGSTASIHDGIDMSPPGCSGQIVVDKAGWLYTRRLTAIVVSGGRTSTYPTTVVYIDHADGLTSQFGHVLGDKLDPVIAKALAESTTTKHGLRSAYVQQGMRITNLDAVGCHVHYEIDATTLKTPTVYPYGGDSKARYVSTESSYLNMRIDPLSVLSQSNAMLKTGGNGKKLPSWYYRVYGEKGFPPPYDPAKLGLPAK